ncbi:Ddb1- and cul4-associated factor 12-like [Plakobranchus ocellatus]|uniref:Ddb1- and cul4-associated factor 12-like n=1 Tax=Plakobranchus ocellatus TaxID=259542 RepID=A0AAV4CQZ2_9GAST|nr:Ddb1- and cul4-associated factor 12-like [Plakobranchus ocellatus]
MSNLNPSNSSNGSMNIYRLFVQSAVILHDINTEDAVTNDEEDEEPASKHNDDSHLCKVSRPLSSDAIFHIRNREYGLSSKRNLCSARKDFLTKRLPDFVSQHLPAILAENELQLGTVNKVFASKWLNDSEVVMGTKCNKLLVMDVNTKQLTHKPSLKSSSQSTAAECPCGIHSIAINPSCTMLATGGENTNDLAIYELPSFDPICVGEQAHKDWIFDMDWIDDGHVVTGSRDSSVALWRVDNLEAPVSEGGDGDGPGHSIIKPCVSKPCPGAMRVRALSLSRGKRMMGVLSMNAKFHFWDIETFNQLESVDLPWRRENVCMASSEDLGVFAVGSQSYVTLIDQRHKGNPRCNPLQIPPSHGERGIRSLSFNQNMITIGTGDGRVLFYDMRAAQFLHRQKGTHCELHVGDGWLKHDANYWEHFVHVQYPNAIFTHCYDKWNARLFVAGGPLPAGLYGNYAGLFY